MAGMGQPNLTIAFHKAAEEVVNRLKNGIVAVIVRDTGATAGLYTLADPEDMPSGLGAEVQAYITRAFLGGDGKPQKVLLSVIGAEDDLVEVGCAALASSDFDYLACPADVEAEQMTAAVTWLDGARKKYCIGKLVLPNHKADNMAVVDFVATGIVAGGQTYTAGDYCSRIAGVLAGTPIESSATSTPLAEVSAVDEIADPDTAADSGQLILIHDGRKVKLGRAVNSLTTVSGDMIGCMIIDYATGSAAALRAGEWSSRSARDGIWHKLGSVVAVIVASILDTVIGHLLGNVPGGELPFTYTVLLCPLVVIWYILTEAGSIIENAGALGAPIPAWLTKMIAALKQKVNDTGDEVAGKEK